MRTRQPQNHPSHQPDKISNKTESNKHPNQKPGKAKLLQEQRNQNTKNPQTNRSGLKKQPQDSAIAHTSSKASTTTQNKTRRPAAKQNPDLRNSPQCTSSLD
ncbi:hypothetical protein Ancab_018680 [Ancistrocladus abbreviatus]